MGVRPPSDDTSEPDVIEFGIAALEPHLTEADLAFPADVGTLERQLGHVEVAYDASGNTITMGSVLEELDEQGFDTQRDLLNALHPVFEQKRAAAGRSLIAQLRGLVPF
jgi:hypothetical protein